MLFRHWLRRDRLSVRRAIGRAGRGVRARWGQFERLEDRSLLAATPQLVKDINADPLSSNPHGVVTIGGTTLFTADDGVHSRELWKTDGTAAGTKMIKDIREGYYSPQEYDGDPLPASSDPNWFTSFKGKLFFSANDGIHGDELWVSDGTSDGTTLFKNINPNGNSIPKNLTVVNDTLFFTAYAGAQGISLWKSDGTADGTVLVKPILDSGGRHPDGAVNVRGTLFFVAYDNSHGWELWKSDGTEAGTSLVKDIFPGRVNDSSGSFPNSSGPRNLTAIGGRLYFTANNGTHGEELWRSDGTEAGTRLVKNITSGAQTKFGKPVNFAGTLFFYADDGVHGAELWKSNGTAASTVMVKDINSGSGSSPDQFLVVGERLYFAADDGVHGAELWRSDGTEAGTRLVKNITTGGPSKIGGLVDLNGKLHFSAVDNVHGLGLWASNGTASGTRLIADINPDAVNWTSYWFGNIANSNGTLFLTADDGVHGRELWKSDGTTQGTALVKDILTRTPSSNPANLTDVNGTLFFTASDQNRTYGLWKTSGDLAGAVFVKAITPSADLKFISFGGALYFNTSSTDGKAELWKSDGTADGTQLVKQVELRSQVLPSPATAAAASASVGNWNTVAGSVVIWNPGPSIGTTIRHLVGVGGRLYFVVRHQPGFNGFE